MKQSPINYVTVIFSVFAVLFYAGWGSAKSIPAASPSPYPQVQAQGNPQVPAGQAIPSPVPSDWDPLQEMEQMQQKMEQFLRDSWPQIKDVWKTGKIPFRPELDLTETREAFVVKADLPGLSKQEIRIGIQDRLLTLSGERKQPVEQSQVNVYAAERRFGPFERSFMLPSEVITDKVTAQYTDGVLEIVLPKTGDQTAGRQVEIPVS